MSAPKDSVIKECYCYDNAAMYSFKIWKKYFGKVQDDTTYLRDDIKPNHTKAIQTLKISLT